MTGAISALLRYVEIAAASSRHAREAVDTRPRQSACIIQTSAIGSAIDSIATVSSGCSGRSADEPPPEQVDRRGLGLPDREDARAAARDHS